MDNEKDFLNPEDFDDLFEDESTDGKEDDSKNNDDESTDSNDDENAKTHKEEEEQKKKNSEFARRRREKEEADRKAREQKLMAQAKTQGKLEMIKTNPYTRESIEDEEDLKIYEVQKQLDEEGLDPLNDLPKRLAELERKKIKEAEAVKKAKEEKDKKMSDDYLDFKKQYPDVDIEQLANDKDFLEFAAKDNKSGRWKMSEIYSVYLMQKNNSAEEENAMTGQRAKELANRLTKNPSSYSGGRAHNKTIADLDVNNPKDREAFEKYFKKKYGG